MNKNLGSWKYPAERELKRSDPLNLRRVMPAEGVYIRFVSCRVTTLYPVQAKGFFVCNLIIINERVCNEYMPSVNVSLQVIPRVPDERVYPVVDKVIEYIAASGVKYEVGPMETTMEGELDKLLDIVREAQNICVNEGASRVLSVVKIDFKPEGVTMDEKIGKYRK